MCRGLVVGVCSKRLPSIQTTTVWRSRLGGTSDTTVEHLVPGHVERADPVAAPSAQPPTASMEKAGSVGLDHRRESHRAKPGRDGK